MSINLPSTITGGAQTGFTAPTYITTPDVAPSLTGKQVAVVSLGGTQAGVTTHSVQSPFTIMFSRPQTLRRLGMPAANGYIASVPTNSYKMITRKGLLPAAGQPTRVGSVNIVVDIPAGADVADPANVRAMLSAAIGTLSALSAGFGDTLITGLT